MEELCSFAASKIPSAQRLCRRTKTPRHNFRSCRDADANLISVSLHALHNGGQVLAWMLVILLHGLLLTSHRCQSSFCHPSSPPQGGSLPYPLLPEIWDDKNSSAL